MPNKMFKENKKLLSYGLFNLENPVRIKQKQKRISQLCNNRESAALSYHQSQACS